MKNLIIFYFFVATLLLTSLLNLLPTTANSFSHQLLTAGEQRDVSPFDQLELEGAFVVNLVQGNVESVIITAPDDISSQIITRVENGTLKIYTEKKINSSEKISLAVNFKNLKSIDCSGAIVLNGNGPLKFNELSFDASGACKVMLDLSAAALDVDISGAGTTSLTGSVSKVNVDISGAGKYMASGLAADEYDIDISGTGNAEVNAAKSLDVEVSGTGNVKYSGDPKITKEISGTGKVSKL